MAFERIEKLKDEYTDKYVVVVDDGRPELSRFDGFVGQVITVLLRQHFTKTSRTYRHGAMSE